MVVVVVVVAVAVAAAVVVAVAVVAGVVVEVVVVLAVVVVELFSTERVILDREADLPKKRQFSCVKCVFARPLKMSLFFRTTVSLPKWFSPGKGHVVKQGFRRNFTTTTTTNPRNRRSVFFFFSFFSDAKTDDFRL